MGMKIPIIKSNLSQPATSGGVTIQNSQAQIGQALQGVGNAIAQIGEARRNKQAKAQIYEAETELRNWSRDRYIDDSRNRLGKNALPDEESGSKGVYQDYAEEADKRISEVISKVDPLYRDTAKQRLESTISGYRDRYAVHQATQEGVYRKQVLKGEISSIEDEVKLDMTEGGGLDSVFEGYDSIAELTKENAKGADVSDYLEKKKADMVREALIAKAGSDPHAAEEMLSDNRVVKTLDSATLDSLKSFVEKKRIEKETEAGIAAISAATSDPASQIDLTMSQIDDQEVQKKVIAHFNFVHKQEENAKTQRNYDLMETVYKEITSNDPNTYSPPTPTQVDNDPRYSDLSPSEKLTIKSWLGGGNPGEFPEGQKQDMWFEATRKIIAGEWNEYDIMEQAGKTVDRRDVKSLVSFARKETTSPQTYRMANEAFKALYPVVYANAKKQAQVMYGVMADVAQYQSDTGNYANKQKLEEILKDNAIGFVKKQWIDSEYVDKMQNEFPTIDEPQYKTIADSEDNPRIDYRTRQVLRYRDSGFPDAFYSSANDAYLLGEPAEKDGNYYYIHDGIRRYAPVGSELHKQLTGIKREK